MEFLSATAAIFNWVMESTLEICILISLIIAIKCVTRNCKSSKWQYFIWLILLAKMLLPWAPESELSVFNFVPASTSYTYTSLTPDIPEEHVRLDAAPGTIASKSKPVEAELTAAEVLPEKQLSHANPAYRMFIMKLYEWLPLIWLGGALVFLGFVGTSNVRMWLLIKNQRPLTDERILSLLEDCKSQMGVNTLIGVVLTDKVNSPALFGFIRPRLLLPAKMLEELSLSEIRYVFLHELAHVKRLDIAVNWVLTWLQVLHWFNPLVWYAFYRIRTDRELACDSLALSKMDVDDIDRYGHTIIVLLEKFSHRMRLPGLAGILENKSQMKDRILMISKYSSGSYKWRPIAIVLLVFFGCVTLSGAKQQEIEKLLPGNQFTSPVADLKLIWSDEFEGTTLSSYWETMTGDGTRYQIPAGWGNDEKQYYTDRKENLFVSDGYLHIVALPEAEMGCDYTSARIRTRNRADFLYGRIEAKIKVPSSKGAWPSFWMLPTSYEYGYWPVSGEIDITNMKVRDFPNAVSNGLIYGGQWPQVKVYISEYEIDPKEAFFDDFHVFAVEWEHDEFRWYLDGKMIAKREHWWSSGGPYPAPFDKPFHILLNLAVGGQAPHPDELTTWPMEMLVDYVRVYEIQGTKQIQ